MNDYFISHTSFLLVLDQLCTMSSCRMEEMCLLPPPVSGLFILGCRAVVSGVNVIIATLSTWDDVVAHTGCWRRVCRQISTCQQHSCTKRRLDSHRRRMCLMLMMTLSSSGIVALVLNAEQVQ